MPGTLKQPMELRSEQLRAMGSPMLQGVLGPLPLYNISFMMLFDVHPCFALPCFCFAEHQKGA